MGEMELELVGERDEVISTLDNLNNIIEKVSEAFNGKKEQTNKLFPYEIDEIKKYPRISKVTHCSDAIQALLLTEWGKTPRTIGDLRDAMKANAIFFPKTTISGVLVWMVKGGRLHRWKDKNKGYLYVINNKREE
jgi:hypothetical protein